MADLNLADIINPSDVADGTMCSEGKASYRIKTLTPVYIGLSDV